MPPPDLATDLRTVPFARDLAAFGDRVALVTPDGEVSYRDLAEHVDTVARRLGDQRRLVLLAGTNDVSTVVVYLAALAAGHPVLLAPGDRPEYLEELAATYDPDVVVRGGGAGQVLDEVRSGSAHVLHPELALLLATSGSTGSAKLVRLSPGNLQSNAESIATYLGIRPDDRAATTLPMHYCYGLSVVNSYLLRGASLILTDRSVTDPAFWQEFRRHRGTSLAGVPYTFDLLDRVGFDSMHLPHLRYVTQAGGRLAPERVRHYAELGRRHGWDLFVMYGQTEATARMAYLPPDLTASHPGSIGVPVPGGSFRLEPLPEWSDPAVGELVYQGPNVMLGYAQTSADLALGRVVDELYTGDVARSDGHGRYEIVGRRSRFVKVFGLRIDLTRVEAVLERHGQRGCCVGDDEGIVVALEEAADAGELRRLVAQECGLPARLVRVCVLPAIPRLASGKPDHPAVWELTRRAGPATEPAAPPDPETSETPGDHHADLCRIYAEVLGRTGVTPDSSFVSLDGDSLSYVELSVRLERALGRLPAQWHSTPIRDLRRSAPAPGRGGRGDLDTSVALRAISIFLIVGTHAALFPIAGGAHLLIGVAGFNFARFHLVAAERLDRIRHIGRSVGRVVVASMTWIALATLLTDSYSLAQVFLLNYVFGSEETHPSHFWFIESLVYIQLAALLLLAVPVVDRLERRFPFGLPMALAAVGLVTRYELVPGVELATPLVVWWLFALGWAAAKATTGWQRLLVSVAVVATVPGFFDSPRRVTIIMVGLLVLVWVSRIPSVRAVNRVLGVLAGASLYIYLTHWQVYPHLSGFSPALAVLASLAGGIAYAAVLTRVVPMVVARARRVRARRVRPRAHRY